MKIRIVDSNVCLGPYALNNAPIPKSSSEPNEIDAATPPKNSDLNRDAQGNPI